MSNCTNKNNFPITLPKTGFVANDNWREAPGFDMLHHIGLWYMINLGFTNLWLMPSQIRRISFQNTLVDQMD